jgi:hypothetical protein
MIRHGGTMVGGRASQVTLPVTGRSRGMVISFPLRRPDGRRMPSGAAQTAKTPAPGLVSLRERRDDALNADWDRFMTLVIEAWCWRDPDCFAALEESLARLRRSVDRDWS